MRRTLVAVLAVTALVAACQQPAEPAAEPAQAVAPTPAMPADAPPQEEVDPAVAAAPAAEPVSCSSELGEAAAIRLVERCVQVSPASHPPCHPDNPCALIQGEIDRSCAGYPAGQQPAQCGA